MSDVGCRMSDVGCRMWVGCGMWDVGCVELRAGARGRLVDAPAKALFCDFPKLIIVAHRAGDESKTPRRRIEATRLGSGGECAKCLRECCAMLGADAACVVLPEVVGFTCPCYTSIRRTSHNFLLNVPMTADSMETVHKWIFRGVALLTTKT
eukprot:958166-Rhodomonas_salina.2